MSRTLESEVIRVRKYKKKNKKGLHQKYYKEYIHSNFWYEIRSEKLRKKPICECCGVPSECVHHETYFRLGRERMTDLRSLCNDCHYKIHFVYNKGRNSRTNLKRAFVKLREALGIYPYGKQWEKEN